MLRHHALPLCAADGNGYQVMPAGQSAFDLWRGCALRTGVSHSSYGTSSEFTLCVGEKPGEKRLFTVVEGWLAVVVVGVSGTSIRPPTASVMKGNVTRSGWQGSCTCSACLTCTHSLWLGAPCSIQQPAGWYGQLSCWCCFVIVLGVYHSSLRMHLLLGRAPLFGNRLVSSLCASLGLWVVVGGVPALVDGWEAVNVREGPGSGVSLGWHIFRHLLALERDVLSNRAGICCSMTEPCRHTGLQRAAAWLAQSVDCMVRLLF